MHVHPYHFHTLAPVSSNPFPARSLHHHLLLYHLSLHHHYTLHQRIYSASIAARLYEASDL